MRHAHGRGDCQYEWRLIADTPESRRCIALPPNRTLIGTDENGPILSEANASGIAFLGTHRGKLLALAEEAVRMMAALVEWRADIDAANLDDGWSIVERIGQILGDPAHEANP